MKITRSEAGAYIFLFSALAGAAGFLAARYLDQTWPKTLVYILFLLSGLTLLGLHAYADRLHRTDHATASKKDSRLIEHNITIGLLLVGIMGLLSRL